MLGAVVLDLPSAFLHLSARGGEWVKTLVGIDEAGYGPTLGPLVLGLAAFSVSRSEETDLYRLLAPWVGRQGEAGEDRLAVDDSKRLYAGRRSLHGLERAALAFLHPGCPLPTRLEEVVGNGAERGAAARRWPPWYRAASAAGSSEVPVVVVPADLEGWRLRLLRELPDQGVELKECRTRPVLEDEFNRSLSRTRNKAATLLEFLAPLIQDSCRRFARGSLQFQIDRLGGRRYHETFLAGLFPLLPLRILEESAACSRYEVTQAGRTVSLSFETKSDSRHLPVALASACAKYVRELFLARLNRYFARRRPGLRPTAGYPTDAARFLADLKGLLSNREHTQLVRRR